MSFLLLTGKRIGHIVLIMFFDFDQFTTDYFPTPADMHAAISEFTDAPPKIDAVSKWYQRDSCPLVWGLVLCAIAKKRDKKFDLVNYIFEYEE